MKSLRMGGVWSGLLAVVLMLGMLTFGASSARAQDTYSLIGTYDTDYSEDFSGLAADPTGGINPGVIIRHHGGGGGIKPSWTSASQNATHPKYKVNAGTGGHSGTPTVSTQWTLKPGTVALSVIVYGLSAGHFTKIVSVEHVGTVYDLDLVAHDESHW